MSIETDMSDRDYEILVQNIHRSIMLNEGMSNVEVQHDVKIEGRSGHKHQVDVFWSFTLAGITYRTAVECRKYKSPISVGRIRDFAGVLDDIGNINEIMVTTRGYQSGAELYAAEYKIKLAILRSVEDSDLENTIRIFVINVNAVSKRVVDWGIRLQPDPSSAEFMEADYAQPHQLLLSNDTGPVDENGTMIKSWLRIESELPEFDTEGTSLPFNEDHVHHLDCSGLYFDHPKFGVMPIQSVTLKYRISCINTRSL